MDVERKARKILAYSETTQRTILRDLDSHLEALERLSRRFSKASIQENTEGFLEAIRAFSEGIERTAECRVEVYVDMVFRLILKRKGML